MKLRDSDMWSYAKRCLEYYATETGDATVLALVEPWLDTELQEVGFNGIDDPGKNFDLAFQWSKVPLGKVHNWFGGRFDEGYTFESVCKRIRWFQQPLEGVKP